MKHIQTPPQFSMMVETSETRNIAPTVFLAKRIHSDCYDNHFSSCRRRRKLSIPMKKKEKRGEVRSGISLRKRRPRAEVSRLRCLIFLTDDDEYTKQRLREKLSSELES